MADLIDISGKKFGRLTVIRYEHSIKSGAHWLCECECGNFKIINSHSLRKGLTKSCGCIRKKVISKIKSTHGMSKTREYGAWCAIKNRCYKTDHEYFERYGGRGIKVCERWLNSFQNFYEDMGPRPANKHSIDRIDNNSDYSPENCRWATVTEQQNNKNINISIKIGDIEKTLSEWCEFYGMNYSTVHSRIRIGWDPIKAITTKQGFRERKIFHNGEIRTVKEWSKITGIPKATILKRIYDGWDHHKAIDTPVKGKKL